MNYPIDLTKSIRILHPKAKFVLNANDYSQLVWLSEDIKKPSLKSLEDAWENYLEEKQANEYKEKRKKEYPDIGDQIDAIWKQLEADSEKGKILEKEASEILQKIREVKNKYKKP